MSTPAPTTTPMAIRFPDPAEAGESQDTEWCEVTLDGELRRFRFHDYDEIYSVPGLYEQLFYSELKCASPPTVAGMLVDAAEAKNLGPADLTVLDVGAGNGMVGEELKDLGAGTVVGVDIIEEAKQAVERDRPAVYDDYFVVDMTAIPAEIDESLRVHRFNALTCVAALGFDDIPPPVFEAALSYLSPGGLMGFSIKESFLSNGDDSGFSSFIREAIDGGAMRVLAQERYRHRLSAVGEELYYVALVAQIQPR
jgi:predicted TPR repeat methyltransferase